MGEMLTVEHGRESVETYLTGHPDRPVVLFLMDAIGLRPQLCDMADRIAGWGYQVMVPNLFHRFGSVEELAPRADLRDPEARAAFFAGGVMTRVKALTAQQMSGDLVRYVHAAAERAPGGRIGVTGYCMGVRHAIRAAGSHPDLVAAVGGWHGGGLVTDDADSPHLWVARAGAEFVFGHADADPSMTPEAVERLGGVLESSGLRYTQSVFAGAAHGYTMADTSTYDPVAAARHYRELEALLARAL
jgi:carboxymethylenebutenolidase